MDHVNDLRRRFKEWVISRYEIDEDDARPQHGLFLCADVEGSVLEAKLFLSLLPSEPPQLCDSRLNRLDMFLHWGLEPCQIGRGSNGTCLTALERLQYMVRQQPSCLHVDWNADHGQWFWPIDDNWLLSADDDHGWKLSLTQLIKGRLDESYSRDQQRLVSGVCVNPQPAGRYLAANDWIGMWNRSCCKCPTCPNHMWIGYGPMLEDKPPNRCQATVQRLDNSIIHLRSNCADVLVCKTCNSKTIKHGARARAAEP